MSHLLRGSRLAMMILAISAVVPAAAAPTPINKYYGNWVSSSTYGLGNVVTFKDQTWLSLASRNRSQTPGLSSSWQLLGSNVPGPTGPQGPMGLTGPAGPQGLPGVPGALGPEGPQGIQGISGTAGVKGDTGPQGQKGDTGASGKDGLNGKDGINGATVLSGAGVPDNALGAVGDFFVDIVNSHFYGPKTADGWPVTYVSMVGPRGHQGEQGPAGIQGPQGSIGLTGSKGDAGETGAQGPAGPKGDPGFSGEAPPHVFDADNQDLGQFLDSIDGYSFYLKNARVRATIYWSSKVGRDSVMVFTSSDCSGTPFYLITPDLPELYHEEIPNKPIKYFAVDGVIETMSGNKAVTTVDVNLFSDNQCQQRVECATYGQSYYNDKVLSNGVPGCYPWGITKPESQTVYKIIKREIILPFNTPVRMPLHLE